MIRWAYVLIGNNNTGKTTFQKELIRLIRAYECTRLYCNKSFDVLVRSGSGNVKRLFVMGRSFQEKEYGTIPDFFSYYFVEEDACVLSSHLNKEDITSMIKELKKRFYNVCGVFFENSIGADEAENRNIALLDWNERYYIENRAEQDDWEHQIRKGAAELSNHLLNKI